MLSTIYAEAIDYLNTLDPRRDATINLQFAAIKSDGKTGSPSEFRCHIHIRKDYLSSDWIVVNQFGDQPEVAIHKAISVLKLILAPKDDDLFS